MVRRRTLKKKKYRRGGGDKEEFEKILQTMSKKELIEIIMNNPGIVITRPISTMSRTQSINLEPEPQLEYKMPQKLDGSVFGFFEGDIYNKLYEGYLDESEYPNDKTCLQVKKLCELDPLYCRRQKFKEKYHKLCKEIKKTKRMIKDYYQKNKLSDFEDDMSYGDKDMYEIDDYIKLKEKLFDEEVIDCLIEVLNKNYVFLHKKNVYSDEYELTWSDLEMYIIYDESRLKDIMYEFGICINSKNPQRYYPEIVEKIKQKILKEYFM